MRTAKRDNPRSFQLVIDVGLEGGDPFLYHPSPDQIARCATLSYC